MTNFAGPDLDNPQKRCQILEQIPPDRRVVKEIHGGLLDLFQREMEYRHEDDANDPGSAEYFEQLYWCGFLLFLVGDPADVPLMWEAKNINMDTGIGFDGQFMVGAGVEETIKYLQDIGRTEIINYISSLQQSKELDELAEWEKHKIHYFYPGLSSA